MMQHIEGWFMADEGFLWYRWKPSKNNQENLTIFDAINCKIWMQWSILRKADKKL